MAYFSLISWLLVKLPSTWGTPEQAAREFRAPPIYDECQCPTYTWLEMALNIR